VTNRETFDSLERWLDSIREVRGENVLAFIVGNKVDLETRSVTFEEAYNRCKEMGVGFMETSAKTGVNVNALFKTIADELPEPKPAEITPIVSSTVKLDKERSDKQLEDKREKTGCSC
jgi:GTPase SAR1 family protein